MNLDLDGIEIVGEEWGVINVEAVAALQPDVIVSEWWPVEQAYSAELAGSLGADLDAGEVADARGRFEQTVAEFEAAVAAKPGLTALAISPTPESLYVGESRRRGRGGGRRVAGVLAAQPHRRCRRSRPADRPHRAGRRAPHVLTAEYGGRGHELRPCPS